MANILDYNYFVKLLNTQIFSEDLNYEILKTVINNPNRYIGLLELQMQKLN